MSNGRRTFGASCSSYRVLQMWFFIYLFFFKRQCHALHELGMQHQPFSSRVTVCWLMNNGGNNKNNVKNSILLLAHQSSGGVISFFPPSWTACFVYYNYRLWPDVCNLWFLSAERYKMCASSWGEKSASDWLIIHADAVASTPLQVPSPGPWLATKWRGETDPRSLKIYTFVWLSPWSFIDH